MKTLALFLFAVTAAAQVPSVAYTVTLTITPPASTAPYTYVVSRAVGTATTCPAPSMTSPVYVPLNQKAPSAALTYVDTPAVSGFVCYSVQSIMNGVPSTPTAAAGPFGIAGQ